MFRLKLRLGSKQVRCPVLFFMSHMDKSRILLVSYPSLYGKGCFITYIGSEFWIFFLVSLVHETRTIIFDDYKTLFNALTVMVFLVLIRASIMTRNEVGNVLSRGYQILVKDGAFLQKLYLLIFPAES